jgi:hypothetical protein
MSKTKKTLAAALVALAAAAAPVAGLAVTNGSGGVHLACQAGSTGCVG